MALLIFSIMVFVGLAISSSSEKTIKRSLGWLIVAISVLGQTICMYYDGHYILGTLDAIIAIMDFDLVFFWYRKYKDAKFTNREKFLREMERSRMN